MFSSHLTRCSNYLKFGNLGFQNVCRVKINHLSSKQGHDNNVVKQVESQNTESPVAGLPKHYTTLSNFQKRLFVWVGKYKNISEVPDKITLPELENASSKVRIKAANYMIILTILGCIFTIFSGRAAHKRGESLTEMNLNWRKELKKQDEEQKNKLVGSE